MELVELARIRADQRAQPRDHLNTEITEGYAEDMAQGAEFPPLVVFFDGTAYWLADGFHRHYAALGCGLVEFACEVHPGGLREAILHSCGANAAHGYRRSNTDKRRAVMRMLEDEEWSKNTDQWIADACHVGRAFVGKMRTSIMPSDSMMDPAPVMRKVTRNGKTYEMNVAKSRPTSAAQIAALAQPARHDPANHF